MNFDLVVEKIRKDRGLSEEVPGFDPDNGNEEATYLFLLEAPGPKAVASGMISFENPDPSARNLKAQLEAAGIPREDIALWNVVPWYLGKESQDQIRPARNSDVRSGIEYLLPILESMRNLRCIVLVGSVARSAHILLSRATTARILSCHHPSARAMNANPGRNEEKIEIFRFMKATAQ